MILLLHCQNEDRLPSIAAIVSQSFRKRFKDSSLKHLNGNFKAKSIRDDRTIYKSVDEGKIKTSLQRLLDARESKWQQEQKKLKALHIEERLDRGKKREDYINKILAKCKT